MNTTDVSRCKFGIKYFTKFPRYTRIPKIAGKFPKSQVDSQILKILGKFPSSGSAVLFYHSGNLIFFVVNKNIHGAILVHRLIKSVHRSGKRYSSV